MNSVHQSMWSVTPNCVLAFICLCVAILEFIDTGMVIIIRDLLLTLKYKNKK